MPFTPKTLTFQNWKELGNEIHINFFTFAKIGKADDETIIKESLSYALDMTQNPDKYRLEHYHIGLKAYDAWINAVNDGYGASHGNWWNGTVWRECREMASRYFSEIATKCQGKISKKATELSNQYKKLADIEKIRTLQDARESEETCINEIEELLNALRLQ